MKDKKKAFGRVPESITFGYKILQLPTLKEMGIPIGGYGECSLNDGLNNRGYKVCWINRGDPLLTYDFQFFKSMKKPLLPIFGDSTWHQTFEIVSPISGLYLSTRQEKTIVFFQGKKYYCADKYRLPIMLVPNGEPLPDLGNFHVYNQIAEHLTNNFDLIPTKYARESGSHLVRLRDWMDKITEDGMPTIAEEYLEYLRLLQERDSYNSYKIREISGTDRGLINIIQDAMGKDLYMREKLDHISRKYGKTI